MAMGLRDLCIAIMAGGVASTGTVAVQKATAPKPVVERKIATKPVVFRKAPVRATQTPAAPSAALLSDCPTPSADLGGLGIASPIIGGSSFTRFHPAGALSPEQPGWWIGGGGFGPLYPSPPTLPAVPEAATWAMMITGFGCIGLACRRREART